jgi:hypothetical protein
VSAIVLCPTEDILTAVLAAGIGNDMVGLEINTTLFE